MNVVSRPRHGLSLCAGGGGLDMGLMLAEPGFHTRAFVEWEEYPRRVLIAAQRAGYFAPAPIWDDLTTFDGRPFRGAFDTILAGYPCQPFSHAGQRRGHDDERHLWPDVARVIREVEPEWVFLENVAGHVSLGAEAVLREIRGMGYTTAAGLFSASETGAPHERLRWFCVAHRAGEREREPDNAQRPDAWQHSRGGVGGSGGRLHGVDVADAEDGDGRIHARSRREGGGAADAERPIGPVGHSAILGRGEGRAEHDLRLWRDAATGAGGAMADPRGAERQGIVARHSDQGRRQEPDGYSALRGGTGLFPPGPGDRDAWAETLALAPDLAPAAGLADCLAWAAGMASAVGEPGQAAAQSRLRRMADGLAARSRALRLLGNGVVPLVAGHAFRSLAAAHGLRPVDMGAANPETCGDAVVIVRRHGNPME